MSNLTTIGYDDLTNLTTMADVLNISNVTTATPPAFVMETDHIQVQKIIYNILGPIVCMFGMVTNVVNLIVLTQNELPESPYTQLTGLACTDFTALMLSFIYMMFSKDSVAYEWKFYDAYIFIGCVNICTTSSVWITVQLTIERFLFVRHPLWAKDTCDRASAKVKILVTVAIAAVLNIPRFLVFKPEANAKIGGYYLASKPIRMTDFYLAMNWIYSLVVHFIPLIILCIANFYLVYAVHQAGKQRQKLEIRNNREAAWQREQRRLTITLISIVFLFIVCIIPSAFSDRPIAYAMFGGNKTMKQFTASNFYFNLQYIANFLVWLELSLNFVLYLAFNGKFRRVLRFTGQKMVKKLRTPFCRKTSHIKMQATFRSGQSSTRNSLLNTNSLTLHSKHDGQLNKSPEDGYIGNGGMTAFQEENVHMLDDRMIKT